MSVKRRKKDMCEVCKIFNYYHKIKIIKNKFLIFENFLFCFDFLYHFVLLKLTGCKFMCVIAICKLHNFKQFNYISTVD